MKNLIAISCLLSLCCVASAGSVSWYAADVQASPEVPYVINETKYAAYLYIGDTVTYDSVIALLNGGYAQEAQALAAAGRSSTAYDAGEGVGAMRFLSKTYGSYSPGTTVSGFMVIVDSFEMKDAANYLVALADGTGSAMSSVTFSDLGNLTLGWGNQGSNTAWKEIGAVPEPFSGALVLIGLAGIGLKRKFRKLKKAKKAA